MVTLRVIIFYCALAKCIDSAIHLKERYNWKQLDYDYPSEYSRQKAINSGQLQPENLLPLGIELYREKIFITIPRWRDGVAATLTYIDTIKSPSGSPKLIPYPSWEGNRFGDCQNGLQYAFRLNVDRCNRLWVFDAGYSGTFTNRTQVCPPAVIVYDLNTNERLVRYDLDQDVIRTETFIANIVVDIGEHCNDAFAYLADPMEFGIVVYSLEKNDSWRFNHAYFFPDPLKADFNVDGFNYQWEVGVLSMALSEIKPDGYRTLYFSPITSYREFNVSTQILRDKQRVGASYHDFNAMDERGANGHVVSQVIDEASGVMLFNLIDTCAVGCWHTSTPYNPAYQEVVDYDDRLIFQSDLKLDENRNVWVFSNRLGF